ncbi:ImmA/IrrE family metallo-endopeptidase [Tenuibacillus multivorans]|uniref:IrrE N-terminal-like domain-containing protein n=1 Tax=Tenuibacillus multivorans TaxID=237069 RepID=A0A1H0DGQ4_9BACI|nr:ImmA/IrrE family metallo-endopeptidase [Tenuibacillus multivorans]GEL76561.1 hypothetical protein TMU01_07960 [Tenuibacillus multivorans]SDN69284.1 protein of unknown function [Tenuibacillus multivorans]
MTTKTYKPTSLESWVSRFYRLNGLLIPEDLQPKEIAERIGIMYIEEPRASYSVEQDNFKLINVNENLNDYEKREHFYHELCHILRHYGNQMMMPKAFRELQEWDARHFTLYASIPFHMLHNYKFKDEKISENLAIDFNVPHHIAKERVSRILRNAIIKKNKTVI